MTKKKRAVLVLISILLIVPAVFAYAVTVSATHTFFLEKWITIDLAAEGLLIKDIRFTSDTKATTGRFGLSATRGPYVDFVIYNNSGYEMDYGVSIALFDKDGNLITANSYSHTGELEPGERHEGTIVFGEVHARYFEAKKFKIVLETY
jgi:hypothetical protein